MAGDKADTIATKDLILPLSCRNPCKFGASGRTQFILPALDQAPVDKTSKTILLRMVFIPACTSPTPEYDAMLALPILSCISWQCFLLLAHLLQLCFALTI